MVFNAPTRFNLFKQRRKQLLKKLKEKYAGVQGVVMIGAGFESDRYIFRQESSFYYLTGIVEPAVILLMDFDGREFLYVPHFGISRSQWVNVTLDVNQDAKRIEVDEIRYLGSPIANYSFKPIFTDKKYENFIADLSRYISNGAQFFTLLDQSNQGYFMNINLYERLQEWIPELNKRTTDIAPILHEIRRIKDEYEIDLIYKAVQITNMAQKAAAELVGPGKYEYEVQAAVECVFTHTAAAFPAFPSIVATGKNTTILHYTQRNEQLNAGDLVVVDIGAEYGFYAADLTRTYPVGGRFLPRQREIYDLVLATQIYVESQAVPGMYLKNAQYPEKSLHHLAVKFLEKHGYAQYFCHGIGHYLGLDVHDVGDYQTPLQAGDVFTIEPGLYIPQENIGIRIEDDYVMADDGAVCLSHDLPKQVRDIERLMNSK